MLLYKDIDIIISLVKNIELNVVKSLSRRRFVKLFRDEIENFEEMSQAIKEKYADKNADGTMKIVDNKIQYQPDQKKLANKELRELSDLEVKIDFSKNVTDVKTVIDVLTSEKQRYLNSFKVDKDSNEIKMTDDQFTYIEIIDDCLSKLEVLIK